MLSIETPKKQPFKVCERLQYEVAILTRIIDMAIMQNLDIEEVKLRLSESRVQSNEFALRGARLSIISEVARNYYELRGNQKRLSVLKRNIELQSQTVILVSKLIKNGLCREVDISHAKASLANSKERLPAIEADIRENRFRIAVLMRQSPHLLDDLIDDEDELPLLPEVIAIEVTSDLIHRRPDIQQAERLLAASYADVGVAVACLYPSFNLVANIGRLSTSSSELIENVSETFLSAGMLRLPIFEAGRLRNQIKIVEIRQSVAAKTLERTVLNAFEETENALSRQQTEKQTYRELSKAVLAAKESVELSKILYDNELTNFLTLLDAERELTTFEDLQVQSETRLMAATIALYKSLGGGWEMFEDEQLIANVVSQNEI